MPVDAKALMWGIEGLVLIYAGFKFNNFMIRIEGYVIYLLAVTSLAFQSYFEPDNWLQLMSVWDGFRTLSMGLLIWSAYKLLNHFKKQNQNSERCLCRTLTDIFTLWAIIGWITLIFTFNPQFVALSAIVPMIWGFYRANKFHLPFGELIAWSPLLLLMTQIVFGFLDTGTFRFLRQSIYTQIAWVELMVLFWSLQNYYEKFSIASPFLFLSRAIRLLVYLAIPVFFLPKVFRDYLEILTVALWVSTTLAWLLHKWIKHPLLHREMSILYFIAIAISILTMINGSSMSGYLAVGSSLIFITAIMLVEKPFSRQALKQTAYCRQLTVNLYYIAICLFAMMALWTQNVQNGLLTSSAYLLAIMYRTPVLALMRTQLRTTFYMVLFILLSVLNASYFSIGSELLVSAQVLMVLLMVAFMALKANLVNKAVYRRITPLFTNMFTKKMWLFNLMVLAGYLLIVKQWTGSPFTVTASILLILHAMTVMFMTLNAKYKQLIRLATTLFGLTAAKVIFYDMNDYSVIHKVIALMGIGAILLLGAYQYQKLKVRQGDHF